VQPAELNEAARIMRICNACRYCEGYCAVFPAIERRENFSLADLNYLASLCHNCGECLAACQYAPPHEFGVDVPKLLEQVRNDSYREYAWPRPVPSRVLIALGLIAPVLLSGRGGNFYSVIPYSVMIGLFVCSAFLVIALCTVGLIRFWRDGGESFRFVGQPVRDALTLRYLGGPRRWFHHFTFYGFALCFASTCTAAVYQNVLGLSAPYAYFSVPVMLGTGGGVALLAGTAGLMAMKHHSTFLVLLFLTAASGLALLAMRDTAAMSFLLVGHLGVVLALFLTMPYGKFVHAIYRPAALLKYAIESRGIHR
jgi:citrate/tricarballylate utilization protein